MKFSLLSEQARLPEQSCAPNDLSLAHTFNAILGANRRTDYFLSVISRPLTEAADIEYRRDVIRDLIGQDQLLERLKTVFNRYDAMKNDWLELRGSAAGRSASSAEAELDAAWASLKVTALFPNTLVSFFTNIRDALSGRELTSQALCRMRDYCDSMLADKILADVVEVAERFRYKEAEDFCFELALSLNERLEVVGCAITDLSPKQEEKRSLRSLLSGKKQPSLGFSGGEGAEDAKRLLAAALSDIDDCLSSLINSIYDSFYGISAELAFYESALEYIRFLEQGRLGCCYPRLCPPASNRIEISSLRDLYLAASGMEADRIVPNDISLSPRHKGMLIRGENGAGKTTFLRSLGTAQFLCQAGLPIPARDAELSIRNGIFTHFSAAEEKFMQGDTAGRFEGEARALSRIIASLVPNSLLLLNETFQTTAFSEGTSAMADILRILPRAAVQYIFVTHLTGLFDKLDDDLIKCVFDEKEHKYTLLDRV